MEGGSPFAKVCDEKERRKEFGEKLIRVFIYCSEKLALRLN